ncbi:MAG: hypothetical protein WA082_02195 [Candidatus Moraniibacteriota bacterium]
MELRELIAIFQKQRIFYAGFVFAGVLAAWIWQTSQTEKYQATLLVNIGRAGVSATTEYTYDSFYRLQADERFADTVVRWFSSPRVVEDIYREAGLNPETLGLKNLESVFVAGRLSSQIITVKYSGQNARTLERLATAAVTVLNRYTETLNTKEREKSWFVVLGNDPVIRDGRAGLSLSLLVGLALGVFFGLWVVLLRHYLARE